MWNAWSVFCYNCLCLAPLYCLFLVPFQNCTIHFSLPGVLQETLLSPFCLCHLPLSWQFQGSDPPFIYLLKSDGYLLANNSPLHMGCSFLRAKRNQKKIKLPLTPLITSYFNNADWFLPSQPHPNSFPPSFSFHCVPFKPAGCFPNYLHILHMLLCFFVFFFFWGMWNGLSWLLLFQNLKWSGTAA